jgi:hypothetical protein
MAVREMQAFRGFRFHRCAKRIALDVMCEKRTEKNGRSRQCYDHEQNRDPYGVNKQFPSQDRER